ncbi:MAG: hypothetical protein JXA38_00295 [Methanosarcinaceae archaeon]|nr:hypothetical protein [Methanosarcinaceae archaeon]
MIRLERILPKAFLIGIVELVNSAGPEKAYLWMQSIGEKLGEGEGPGFEGAREDNINYMPLCPFANHVVEFVGMYGERPSEFMDIIRCANERRDRSKNGWQYPAIANIFCVLHHSFRVKRASMAGAEILHLGCKSPLTEITAYNEKAIEKSGMTKDDVDKILEKSICVFKIEYPDTG